MSEAPERIWAWWDDTYDVGLLNKHGDKRYTPNDAKEYVRADRIEELEGMLPEDNRPCSTDRFLVAVIDEIDDHYDRLDAIKCWIEGAWDEAIKGTTLAELTSSEAAYNEVKGGKDE